MHEGGYPEWRVVARTLREMAGLTQDGWAARLAIGRATVQRWERGTGVPSAETEAAIIDFCRERGLFRAYTVGPLAGLRFSSEDLARLLGEARAATGGGRPPAPVPPLNADVPAVPAPLTSFIGRDAELAARRDLLTHTRLLTLTGPPGVGKTTLAQHLAIAVAPAMPDGVVWVALDALADPAQVPAATARALDLRDVPGQQTEETVRRVLTPRRSLLVFDNFEHVLDAAPFVADLLTACLHLRVLVTSRAPLHLRAEQQAPVEPLPYPPVTTASDVPAAEADVMRMLDYPAVRLFVERARAVRPDIGAGEEWAGDIATICALLEGLPLAIELAAVRVALLSPREIARQLRPRLAFLTGGYRDLSVRHRTLRAAIDWSHDLLPAAEQRAFRLLGVFAGGGTLETAATVAEGVWETSDGSAGPGASLLDLLMALTDQSLIRRVDGPGGVSRFRMLESIREYALERLAAAGEDEAAHLHHAAWYTTLAEQAAPELIRPDQAVWLERLEVEHDGLLAALQWMLDNGPPPLVLRLVVALWRFWQTRGYLSEGRTWLERSLARAGDAPAALRAAALCALANLAHDQGDYTGAVPYAEAGLQLARETDERVMAEALMLLAVLAFRRSDYGAATALGEECLTVVRTLDEPRLAGRCLNLLALLDMDGGRFEVARGRLEESLAAARAAGDLRTSAVVLNNLGLTAERLGDLPVARARLEESLALNRRLGNRTEIARNLITLALVLRGMRDLAAADAHARDALAISREVRNRNGITEALNQLSGIARERGDLPAAHAYNADHLREAREMDYPVQMLAAVAEAAANARVGGAVLLSACLFGAEQAGREALGLAQHEEMHRTIEAHKAALREQLEEQSFADAWARGMSMTLAGAVDYALRATA